MRSKHLFCNALVAIVCFAVRPVRAGQALPNVTELLRQVEKNQHRVEQDREKYSFTDIEEQQTVGRGGKVTDRTARQYDVFFLNGQLIRRMVKKNGKPLSASAQRKEDSRVRQEVEKLERQEQKVRQSGEKQIGIGVFLRASRFSNPHWVTRQGRKALAFDFAPNPAFKPSSQAERIAHDLRGVMWVDAQAREVVRLKAGLESSYRIAGGLLASVEKGTTVTLEQKLVDGDVWLPSYSAIDVSARMLLLKHLRMNIIDHYSHYRVFSVKSLSDIVPPERHK